MEVKGKKDKLQIAVTLQNDEFESMMHNWLIN